MNSKKMIFLIFLSFNYSLIGMDIISKCKTELPAEIVELTISGFLLSDKQWWYCDQRFQHPDSVVSVSLNSSGDCLATGCGGDDGKARIFDASTEKEKVSIARSDWVSSVSLNSSGNCLAIVFDDGDVRIFDVSTIKEKLSIDHPALVYSVSLNSNSDCLATGCDDKNARIFDTSTGKEKISIAHPKRVMSVSLNSNGDCLATGCGDKNVRIFDASTGKEKVSIPHFGMVHSVSLNSGGNCLATGCNGDNNARIFDASTGKEKVSIPHFGMVHSVSLNSSGDCLATGCGDNNARIFRKYSNYTIEQLQLKLALMKWLSIEKPSKAIIEASRVKAVAVQLLLADVSKKCELDYDAMVVTWDSFPEKMRNSIMRTMFYRIEQYGK